MVSLQFYLLSCYSCYYTQACANHANTIKVSSRCNTINTLLTYNHDTSNTSIVLLCY